MNLRTVKGKFTNMEGTISFNPKNINKSYLNVCIDTQSLKTDTKRRDRNLKKKGFFDVENYPEICFESESVLKIFGDYIVTGKLTMLGVSKTVRIPLTFSKDTLNGSFVINRNDFNFGKNISSFMIDDHVTISINCKLKEETLALHNDTTD